MTYSTAEDFRQPIAYPISEKGFLLWKRPEWRLVEDYTFEWGPPESRRRITIKAGYEWDGSSVPAWAAVLGHLPVGPCFGASLIHDRFCQSNYDLPEGEYQVKLPDGSWVNSPGKWRGLEVHELYRYMCVLGGMGEGKALTRKIAVALWPPNWK